MLQVSGVADECPPAVRMVAVSISTNPVSFLQLFDGLACNGFARPGGFEQIDSTKEIHDAQEGAP